MHLQYNVVAIRILQQVIQNFQHLQQPITFCNLVTFSFSWTIFQITNVICAT
jgi:hypothetical protein